jgi:hypothetical protein
MAVSVPEAPHYSGTAIAEAELGALHGEQSLTAVLAELASEKRQSIALATLAVALGGRAHALTLLILVLPETIPLPVPSISIALGLPLMVIAGHLVLHGDGSTLPRRVGAIRVPTSGIRVVLRWLGPTLAWLERSSHPRWRELARHERLAGVICLYLSIILALPIPFVNLIPALCLAAVALGLIRRDGLYVAIGLAGTAGLTLGLVYIAMKVGALFAN